MRAKRVTIFVTTFIILGFLSTFAQQATFAAEDKAQSDLFTKTITDSKHLPGLFGVYLKKSKLYAALGSGDYNKDLLVLVAISRGIGTKGVYAGKMWDDGDEWIWQFRKREDRVQIIRRNLRYRAGAGTPTSHAISLAFTDSVMYSLPIIASSGGFDLIDITPVFYSDYPQVGKQLPGHVFSSAKSSWTSVHNYPKNIELEVDATYESGTKHPIASVADGRSVNIGIHYSISALEKTDYQPRLADERVGYFVTAFKNFSGDSEEDYFVRYINRWNIQKAAPSMEVSLPKKPLVFWIEKTVPHQHRQAIRDGILEWNKAFEKVGIADAIEVRQQPDNATWSPEDVNYNTIRWSPNDLGFSIGPSRVNPLTGEILDADLVFDIGFLASWDRKYKFYEIGGKLPAKKEEGGKKRSSEASHREQEQQARIAFAEQFVLAQLALEIRNFAAEGEAGEGEAEEGAAKEADKKESKPKMSREKFFYYAMRALAMHEVGHALGLRHNFKGSTYFTLEEMNNPERGKPTNSIPEMRERCISGSVMDYLPINIAPQGQPQGPYFSTALGPYDYHAIEYGYKPGLNEEALRKIASRGDQVGLAYASDSDIYENGPDPYANSFDLGENPLDYAKQQMLIADECLPRLLDLTFRDGADYTRTRTAYNLLLAQKQRSLALATRFLGGIVVNRDHRGDAGNRKPFVVVPKAVQEEALKFVLEKGFGEKSWDVSPEIFSYLGDEKWRHWGTEHAPQTDYPASMMVIKQQQLVVSALLSSTRMQRLLDATLKVSAEEETLQLATVIEGLTDAIFSELVRFEKDKKAKLSIGLLRRNLQSMYVKHLIAKIKSSTTPPDGVALIRFGLKELQPRFESVPAGRTDLLTRVHFAELAEQIDEALDKKE